MVKLSEVKVGDLVVVGLSGYPRWPAFVVDPSWIPENDSNSPRESANQKTNPLPSSDNRARITRRSSLADSPAKKDSMFATDTSKSRRRSTAEISRRRSTAEISKNRRRSSRLNDADTSVDSLIELSTNIFQDEKKPVMFINDECYMYISGRQIKYLTKEMCESFIGKYKPLIENHVNPSLWRLPGNIKRYFPQILGAYELAYCYLQNPQVSLTEIPSILSSKLYNNLEDVPGQNDKHVPLLDSKLYEDMQSLDNKDKEDKEEEKQKKETNEEKTSCSIIELKAVKSTNKMANDNDDTIIDAATSEQMKSFPQEQILNNVRSSPQEQSLNNVKLDKSSTSVNSDVEEISYYEMTSSEFSSEMNHDNIQNSFIRKNSDTTKIPINLSFPNENIIKDEQAYKIQKYSFEMPDTEKLPTITKKAKAEIKSKSSSSNKEPSFKNILSNNDHTYFSKSRSISNHSKLFKQSSKNYPSPRNNNNFPNTTDSGKNKTSLKKSKYLAPHFDNILNSDDAVFPNRQSYSFSTSPYSSSHSFSSPEVLYANSRDSIADITNFTNNNISNIRTSPSTFSTNDTMRIDNLVNDTQVSKNFNNKNSIVGEAKNSAPSQVDNNFLEVSHLSLKHNDNVVPTKSGEFYRHTQFKEEAQKHYQLESQDHSSKLSNNDETVRQKNFFNEDNHDPHDSSSDISDIDSTRIKKEEEYIADLDLTDYFISPLLNKAHPRPIYRTTFKFFPRKDDRKIIAQRTNEKIKELENEQRQRKKILECKEEAGEEEFYKYQVRLKLAANRLSDEEFVDRSSDSSDDDEAFSKYRKGDDPKRYSEIFDSMTLQRFSRESSTTSSPVNLKRKSYDTCVSPVKKIKLNVSKFHVDTTDSDGFNYSVMKDEDDYMYYFYFDNPEKFNDNYKDDLRDDPKYCFGPEDVQNRIKILIYEITELLTDKFEATDSVLGEFNTKLLLIDDLMNLRIERCVAAVDNFKGIYESINPEKIAKRIVLSRKTKTSNPRECSLREKLIARQIRQFKIKSATIQKELVKKQKSRQSPEGDRLKRISGASTLKELSDAFKLDLWIMEDIENTIKEVAKFLNITLYGKLTKYCNQTWAKRDEQVKCRFIGCLKRIFWEKFRFKGDCLSLLVKRVARLCGHYLNYRTKLMNESLNQSSSNDFEIPSLNDVSAAALAFDLRSNNEQRVSKNDSLVKLSFDQFKDEGYDSLSSSSFNSEDYKVSSDEEPEQQVIAIKPHRQRGRPPAANQAIKALPKKTRRRGRPRRSNTYTQPESREFAQKHFKTEAQSSKFYESTDRFKIKPIQIFDNKSEQSKVRDVHARKNRKGNLVLRTGNRNASTV